jgi:hypothetical protein
MTRRRQPAKEIKMNRIVAILTASVLSAVIGGSAFAEVPYTGNGDPLGLTSSTSPAAVREAAFETAAAVYVEVPYTGNGDPRSLISGGIDFSAIETASVPRRPQVPYTGLGDPDDLI